MILKIKKKKHGSEESDDAISAKEFYEKCHFTCTSQHEDGSKEYESDLACTDYQVNDSYQITIK